MFFSYFKNFNKYRIILLLFTLIFVVMNVYYVFYNKNYNGFMEYDLVNKHVSSSALYLYYEIQSSLHSIGYTVLIFILVSNIFSSDVYIYKYTNYNFFLKLRSKNYYFMTFFLNALLSAMFYLLTQIIIYLTICFIYKTPDIFTHSDNMEILTLFSNNKLHNFLFYIFYSTIGFSLFSSLLFVVKIFIKNIYVYRGIGIILGILLTVIPSIIYTKLSLNLVFTLCNLIYLPNLLNPGIQSFKGMFFFDSVFLNWLLVCLFYSMIIFVLYFITRKMEQKHG